MFFNAVVEIFNPRFLQNIIYILKVKRTWFLSLKLCFIYVLPKTSKSHFSRKCHAFLHDCLFFRALRRILLFSVPICVVQEPCLIFF